MAKATAYLNMVVDVRGTKPIILGAGVFSEDGRTLSLMSGRRAFTVAEQDGETFADAREQLLDQVLKTSYYKWIVPWIEDRGRDWRELGIPMWLTRTGEMVPIESLSDDHLSNIERGIRQGTVGGSTVERENIAAEFRRRGLKQLDALPENEAICISAIGRVKELWKGLNDRDRVRKEIVSLLRSFQDDGLGNIADAIDHLENWSPR
jgi:hypothetical protein